MEDIADNKRHTALKGPYIMMGALYILMSIPVIHEDPFWGVICSVVLGLVYIYVGIF